MNMLTSLKALLFPTPASTDAKVVVASSDGSVDFAQLLNVIGVGPVGQGANFQLDMRAAPPSVALPSNVDAIMPTASMLQFESVKADALQSAMVDSALIVVQASPSGTALPDKEGGLPKAVATPLAAIANVPVTPELMATMSVPVVPLPAVLGPPRQHNAMPTDDGAATPLPDAGPHVGIMPPSPTVPMIDMPGILPLSVPDVQLLHAPIPAMSPPIALGPILSPDAVPNNDIAARSSGEGLGVEMIATVSIASTIAPPIAVDAEPMDAATATPSPIGKHATKPRDTKMTDRASALPPAEMADAQDADISVMHKEKVAPDIQSEAADVTQTLVIAPPPVLATPAPDWVLEVQPQPASESSALRPPVLTMPSLHVGLQSPVAVPESLVVSGPAAAAPLRAAISPTAPAPMPIVNPASIPAVPATSMPGDIAPLPAKAAPVAVASQGIGLQNMTVDVRPATALNMPLEASPVRPGARARTDAVSLLQLVRDHMTSRTSRRIEGVPLASVRSSIQEVVGDVVPVAQPMAMSDIASSTTPLAPTSVPSIAAAPAVPIIDLSASLGAQMVDMGVSGQWIDGLAHDIAGLSANGAQGRFHINADQLGPIQVDIRQNDDGAAISLMVASEAAEQVLRQEGDRLKLDAGLSAVRISEVKIERAPHVTEIPRADASSGQTSSQQQSGGQGHNPGQAMGQGMGQSSTQSHMQGRGQQHENIAFGHKAGSDAVVLDHTDIGDRADGAVRARYA